MKKRHAGLEDTFSRDTLAFSTEADTTICGSVDKFEETLYHVVAALAQTRRGDWCIWEVGVAVENDLARAGGGCGGWSQRVERDRKSVV